MRASTISRSDFTPNTADYQNVQPQYDRILLNWLAPIAMRSMQLEHQGSKN
jgi:hypothetical protein